MRIRVALDGTIWRIKPQAPKKLMRGMISQGNCHAPLRYPEPEPPKELRKVDSMPIKQLPCQIAGGSFQCFLSKALPETGLKLRGNSPASTPDSCFSLRQPPISALRDKRGGLW